MKICLFTLLAGSVAAVSLASQDQYEVFEKISIPAPWTLKADKEVDAEQAFKLRIHLKNRNMESFHQKVLDVSSPDHPDYGRHMSRLDLRSHLAPSDKSYELVLEWLESQGLSQKSTVEEDWVILDGTVGDAEKLLETEYLSYEDAETGKVTVRTLEYSLRKPNIFLNFLIFRFCVT
jgi:tripeptidyl-peptidase-1